MFELGHIYGSYRMLADSRFSGNGFLLRVALHHGPTNLYDRYNYYSVSRIGHSCFVLELVAGSDLLRQSTSLSLQPQSHQCQLSAHS